MTSRRPTRDKKQPISETSVGSVVKKKPSKKTAKETSNRVNQQVIRNTNPEEVHSENIGKKIIRIFNSKKYARVREDFERYVTAMRTGYPTDSHINKFVVGLSVEYLFCHAIKKHTGMPIYLCTDDAVRNDVFVNRAFLDRINTRGTNHNNNNLFNKLGNISYSGGNMHFDYSLKYKSPNKTKGRLSVPNVRLVNTQGKVTDTTNITEDVFLIVPNPPGDEIMGMIVFIPHTRFNMYPAKPALQVKSDGIDMKGSFISEYINDPKNKAYVSSIDIPYVRESALEIDSILILTEAMMKKEDASPKAQLEPSIFLCRQDHVKRR